ERDLVEIELVVPVRIEDPGIAAGGNPGPERAAVAPIVRMVHDAHLGMERGEAIGDFPRAIARAVIDQDDLVAIGELGKRGPRAPHRLFDVLLLVVHRIEQGERIEAICTRARQTGSGNPDRRRLLGISHRRSPPAPYARTARPSVATSKRNACKRGSTIRSPTPPPKRARARPSTRSFPSQTEPASTKAVASTV